MTILTKILEKIAVVTIDAPLNIIYVEPEIKANPIYWSMDENASEQAGMININLLCGFFPYYKVNLVFYPCPKYNKRHRN
jgi:hypothetical protein